MRRSMTAIALAGTVLAVSAGDALARGTDTPPPVLNVATTPASPPSYVNPPNIGPVANGNNGWYTTTAGSPPHGSGMITLSATDAAPGAEVQDSTHKGAR